MLAASRPPINPGMFCTLHHLVKAEILQLRYSARCLFTPRHRICLVIMHISQCYRSPKPAKECPASFSRMSEIRHASIRNAISTALSTRRSPLKSGRVHCLSYELHKPQNPQTQHLVSLREQQEHRRSVLEIVSILMISTFHRSC